MVHNDLRRIPMEIGDFHQTSEHMGIFVQRSLPQNKNKENNEAKLNQPETNNNVRVRAAFKAGQLAKYLAKWREITTDRTLLQYVEGVRIEFVNGKQPTQFGFRPSMFNIHERSVVEKEIQSLLEIQ